MTLADAPALPATEIPVEAENAFRLLAELTPADGERKPLDPQRWVALGPDGTFALLEFIGSVVRQIGPRVGFDGAVDIAAAVCAGGDRARTEPLALHALALALVGGYARKQQDEAAKQEHIEKAGGCGTVSPLDAAGDVPTPAASAPRTEAAE